MGWCGHRRRRGRRAAAGAILTASSALVSGCALVGGPPTFHADVPDRMTVASPDVGPGGLGSAFTCRGGRSPGLHWSGAPQGTKSFALVVDDSDAPITPYIYWIVFDIKPQQSVIQQGQIPPGARVAQNSEGTAGYDPPCPANGPHKYRFTVYALRSWLNLRSGAGVKSAWTEISQAAIARGRLTASSK